MRRPTVLLSLGSVILTACVGTIGGDLDSQNAPTSSADFVCDPAAAKLTPEPVKRLAKAYFVNALGEFLSRFDADAKASLLASLQTRIDLIPTDISNFYSVNADDVTQDHVDAIFGIAVTMAAKIADDKSGYATQILKPCGDGLAKSALDQDACLTTWIRYYGRK